MSEASEPRHAPSVWPRIEPGAQVGEGCRLNGAVWVEAGAVLGRQVIIDGGVTVPRGVVIEDGVEIGSNAAFVRPASGQLTQVGKGCVIGANATLGAGITLGEGVVVEAGAVVLASVQAYAIIMGNPGRVVGFRGADATRRDTCHPPSAGAHARMRQTSVRGVTLHELPFITDPRGNLTVGEFERTVPFRPKRYFITFDVPNERIRGEHAHRECHQFLVCVRGSCAVVVDDGFQREEHLLDRPTLGIHVPPMIWAIEYKHSADSTLMVFASDFYDPDDYIRDYREFQALAKKA